MPRGLDRSHASGGAPRLVTFRPGTTAAVHCHITHSRTKQGRRTYSCTTAHFCTGAQNHDVDAVLGVPPCHTLTSLLQVPISSTLSFPSTRGHLCPSIITCHSLTSLSSGLAWMCVFATQMSVRLAAASGDPGSMASSTAISATLSLREHKALEDQCEKRKGRYGRKARVWKVEAPTNGSYLTTGSLERNSGGAKPRRGSGLIVKALTRQFLNNRERWVGRLLFWLWSVSVSSTWIPGPSSRRNEVADTLG